MIINQKNIKAYFAFFLSFIVIIIMLPLFAPNNPNVTDFLHILSEPTIQYPFGTDQLGRCLFSRILYGMRISLAMSLIMVGIISLIGILLGIFSGFYGGIIDTVLMRFSDILLAFPGLIFAIAVAGLLGPSLLNTGLAVALVWWPKYARVTRGLVITEKNKDYVSSARLSGAKFHQIITANIFPNIVSQLLIIAMIDIGGMIIAIAGLSFLGLGAQPPTPELGCMLNEGRIYFQTAPGMLLFPGLAILVMVVFFNLFGDHLIDTFNPKK